MATIERVPLEDLAEGRRFRRPLTIGVIADTHVYDGGARRLAPEVAALFRRWRVGLILHAGDVGGEGVLAELQAVAPVLAVRGNNEAPTLAAALPTVVRFRVGAARFVLTHGLEGKTARLAARRFAAEADVVVYGHSHLPRIEREGEAILFNPGSPTDRRWGPHFGVGRIVVSRQGIEPELVLFDDPRQLAGVG